MTTSVVPRAWCDPFSPWSDTEPLTANTPMLKGADTLRKSLIPSLLEARRVNESVANEPIELFETARIYLPKSRGLPREQSTLGVTSGGEFHVLKGVVETFARGVAHVGAARGVSQRRCRRLSPIARAAGTRGPVCWATWERSTPPDSSSPAYVCRPRSWSWISASSPRPQAHSTAAAAERLSGHRAGPEPDRGRIRALG